MNVIKESKEFSKQERYMMTHNRNTSLKDAVGVKLAVTGWLYYADVNSRGENVEVLVLVTETGYYSTISQTFANAFLDIAEAFDMPVNIAVVGGVTRNGRDFITCELTQ